LVASMIILPLGICSEVYIVFRKVIDSPSMSVGITGVVLVFFYGLWFGFTSYRRAQVAET